MARFVVYALVFVLTLTAPPDWFPLINRESVALAMAFLMGCTDISLAIQGRDNDERSSQ